MKKLILIITVISMITATSGYSQTNLIYQKPPKSILDLVDIDRAPSISLDSKKEQMFFFYQNTFKNLDDLNQPELKLAGLRINPVSNSSSTISYSNNIKYKKIFDKELKQISNLPEDAKIAYPSLSPDESKLAFINSTERGVELWVIDLSNLEAKKLTESILNANLGTPYSWFKDSKSILAKTLPVDRQEILKLEEVLPVGPVISTSDGQISQNRTYQDLLKNKTDETNFEIIITSEIYKINLDGSKSKWKDKAQHQSVIFSPDGEYVLIKTIQSPYSYLVPFYLFANKTEIYNSKGKLISLFHERSLLENLPIGFMATEKGKRSIAWRSDKPSTLFWVEAQDGGDPANEVPYRDFVYQQAAPFTNEPQYVTKTINRYNGIDWGNEKYALISDQWWNTRNEKAYIFNPSDNTVEPIILSDRNYQDIYNDPGTPHTERNEYNQNVLTIDKDNIYLFGDGFTPEGQFPFIDQVNLKTLNKKRIYTSQYKEKLEDLYSFINLKKRIILTRIQSPAEFPNYYVRDINQPQSQPQPITFFDNPFKSISNIHKEVIKYMRKDGVELTGTLYLPEGYDMNNKEKLPLIMWAYPTEYKDKSSAGQSTANPNTFTYLSYGNPIYWVTRGYAVLDDASFPIVGEGDTEPNDTFVEQLVANAEAAIDKLDKLGYIDRDRVAIGGHSYGAFMTANLLSNSNLFAAGIARSGAYNRTLTPFGFQSEERSYWTSPDVYNKMSPFMTADKMKTPLLLIHGEADNNSGTHTMQSERYFQALKSFGAPVRLVILPKESHGYVAKENILHLLWEQDRWLDTYVKNKVKE